MRAAVLQVARRWLGTPYRHQGSRRGVGCDCLGLVRGVWRELHGSEPERPPPYSPDWFAEGDDTLLQAARRHFLAIAPEAAEPGDLVLFRWRAGRPAQHCGLLDEGTRVIHAYEGAHVVSSPLAPAWARRIAGTFRFPDAAPANTRID